MVDYLIYEKSVRYSAGLCLKQGSSNSSIYFRYQRRYKQKQTGRAGLHWNSSIYFILDRSVTKYLVTLRSYRNFSCAESLRFCCTSIYSKYSSVYFAAVGRLPDIYQLTV